MFITSASVSQRKCQFHTLSHTRTSIFFILVFDQLAIYRHTGQMIWCLITSKNRKNADKKAFLTRNGKILLEKLISSCNSRRNPLRSYSAKELETATDNFNPQNVIANEFVYKLYKGFLEDRRISIMKFRHWLRTLGSRNCFNNIVYASQMSHKNVLKLIGCCLETEIPILVFESVEYGTLNDRICGSPRQIPNFEPLLLKNRLKFAMEIANAVAYLHVGFPRPIVFRDIKPSNVLINEQNVAKLFDFSLSMSIPDGQTRVKHLVPSGTMGFIAPEYVTTRDFNEKCDVYSFGVLLLILLTGQRVDCPTGPEIDDEDASLLDIVKKYSENNRLDEIVDPTILGDTACAENGLLLQTFTKLALKCVSESAENRPIIVDVAKQLRQMYRSC